MMPENSKNSTHTIAASSPTSAVELDTDVLLLIGGLLSPTDLVAANQVCRAWRSALGRSAAPWRTACIGTAADEEDRFDAVPPAPAGVDAELHTWHTLALNHVRTEKAWRTANVRSHTQEIELISSTYSDFNVSSRAGLMPLKARGQAYDILLADRRTFSKVYVLTDDSYPEAEAAHDLAVRFHDDGRVQVLQLRRGALDKVAEFTASSWPFVARLGTRAGISACVCATIPSGVRVYAPPLFEPVDIEVPDYVGPSTQFVFLSDKVFAHTALSDTMVYARSGGAGPVELGALFAFGFEDCAGLVYPFDLGASTAPAPGVLEAEGLVPGDDDAFTDALNSVNGDYEWYPCASHSAIATLVPGPKVIILPNYHDVFDAVVDLPKDERSAYIAARTVALRLDASASSIAAYGDRIAIHMGDYLVVVDIRDLPPMPLLGPAPRLPFVVLQRSATTEDAPPLQKANAKLAIDSRAVYVLEPPATYDLKWRMTVHAFDRT